MVFDCKGRVVEVGDVVYFSLGWKGAQPFIKGQVVEVFDKSVKISFSDAEWEGTKAVVTSFRKSGCFVICNKAEQVEDLSVNNNVWGGYQPIVVTDTVLNSGKLVPPKFR